MARELWTDGRLDDLNKKVDDGFTDMREEFRAVRAEMGAMNRHLSIQTYGLMGTMVVGFLGVIATILTQM